VPKIKKEMQMITEKEYVDRLGSICPFCGSHDIVGDHVEIDAFGASQEVSCNDCSGVWTDLYSLTGYHVRDEVLNNL
jgi:hypothetical protein